jgi:flagellar basal-body rod protein FlgC
MSLFGVMSVSASGMSAQRTRAEAIVSNLANSQSTRDVDGGPYRRREVVFATEPQTSPFSSVFQEAVGMGAEGVTVAEVVKDPRPPLVRYEPGHPDADVRGFVKYPDIQPAEEMADLVGATRAFQANAVAVAAVKDMVGRSIDLSRV